MSGWLFSLFRLSRYSRYYIRFVILIDSLVTNMQLVGFEICVFNIIKQGKGAVTRPSHTSNLFETFFFSELLVNDVNPLNKFMALWINNVASI